MKSSGLRIVLLIVAVVFVFGYLQSQIDEFLKPQYGVSIQPQVRPSADAQAEENAKKKQVPVVMAAFPVADFINTVFGDGLWIGEFAELSYQEKADYIRIRPDQKFDPGNSSHQDIAEENAFPEPFRLAKWPMWKTVRIAVNYRESPETSKALRDEHKDYIGKQLVDIKDTLEGLTDRQFEMLPAAPYTDDYRDLYLKADIVLVFDSSVSADDPRMDPALPVVQHVPAVRFTGAMDGEMPEGFLLLNEDGEIRKAYCRMSEAANQVKLCLLHTLGLINLKSPEYGDAYLRVLYNANLESGMEMGDIKLQ